MGLLDDAIREHLELKRLRGADPSEVFSEERKALGHTDREAAVSAAGQASFDELAGARGGPASNGVESPPEPTHSPLGEETMELDMRAVLAAEPVEAIHPTSTAIGVAPYRARTEPPAPLT